MITLYAVAMASAFACQIDEAIAPRVSTLAMHTAAPFNPDSIRLLALCGNRFAIQNSNDFTADVKWDIVGTSDSGRVTVPARTAGQPFTEVYITSNAPGVARLLYQDQVIETAVSAGLPCGAGHVVPAMAPASVSRSLLDSLGLYPPHRGVRYRRDVLIVVFKHGTPQAGRQQAIDLVRGVVIGGRRWYQGDGSYFIQVPPAATVDDLARLGLRLHGLAHVANAYLANIDEMRDGSYRRPNDGAPWHEKGWRVNRYMSDSANWALEYTDAPLAWGCTTGDSSLRVAVLDYGFGQTAEVDSNTVRRIEPALFLDHGVRVASVLAARGNNRTGMTGMMWRAALDLVNWNTVPPTTDSLAVLRDDQNSAHEENIIRVTRDGASIINISQASPWGSPSQGNLVPPAGAADSILIAGRRKSISDALARLALENRFPLLVISAGNNGLDASVAGYAAARADYPGQIIVVGATANDNVRRRWPDSNHGSLVDIYAPGENVAAINYLTGTVTTASGTSFATPLVTGVAGLVKSFDNRSEISASLIKQLILAGAVDSITEPNGAKKPVLSAYGALKQVALRSGSGTCANRVWVANESIYVRRASGNEAVFAAPASALPSAGHGSVIGAGSTYIAFRNGAWIATNETNDPYDQGSPERSPGGYSHDRDSLASWRPDPAGGTSHGSFVTILHSDTATINPTERTLTTVPMSQVGGPSESCPVQRVSDGQCLPPLSFSSSPIRPSTNYNTDNEQPVLAYSPLGDEILVAMPHLSNVFGPGSSLVLSDCPTYGPGIHCKTFDVRRRVDSTVVWSVQRQTGAKSRLFAVSGKVFSMSLASDGAEIVMITGTAHTGEIYHGAIIIANTTYVQQGPCTTQFFRHDGAQNFSVSGSNCWYQGTLAPKRRPSWFVRRTP